MSATLTSQAVASERANLYTTGPVDCPECHGDGTITVNPSHPDPTGAFDATCPACVGDGVASASMMASRLGRSEDWMDSRTTREIADELRRAA